MRSALPLLLVPLLLMAILWSSLWWWSATRLEAQFRDWQAREAAEGREFHFTDVKVGGFPTHLRLSFSDARMSNAKGWEWHGPAAMAEAPLWQPRDVWLEFAGNHRFLPPPTSLSAPLEFAAEVAQGRLWLDRQGRIEGMRLDLQGLAFTGYFDGGTSARALEIAWGRALQEVREARAALGAGDIAFFLKVEELELPTATEPPLGRNLEELVAEGTIEDWHHAGSIAEAVPAWADQGGHLQLDEVQMTWGPLWLQGDARVTLDEERRPLGAGHARLLGLEGTLDALTQGGMLKEDVGNMARLLLLAMSDESRDGQRQIEVPVTAENGVLRLGPLPLLPLPRLF
ncbi:MAG TPA: DUF2125 domain-containing protein [Kiloniellales bacterium]|nr:DUF2125 domain-containing protein [Kiloniellales bacterium]